MARDHLRGLAVVTKRWCERARNGADWRLFFNAKAVCPSPRSVRASRTNSDQDITQIQALSCE
jgi:hypothetical protein